jgi:hypothetical protein
MALSLKALKHTLLDNRRRYPRYRHEYQAELRDGQNRVTFRGRVEDISRGGVKLFGLPAAVGVQEGEDVRVYLLLVPGAAQVSKAVDWVAVPGTVVRLEDAGDDCSVAIEFKAPLPD